ncbi:hypothetical protein FisN_22Lh075 [Fistulifera solaris]|uniref:Uncharacterized protein n=1 Tax=Fistulifera solaris TaxID=1519565 RepID=A0A1Z5JBY9_FISSO|nr:hypothetical protein FisN_22Lh075 [Fistulifera solaris]|eukprot:GAX11402.1 hypothetical protein FisN_22Lh075 [Fistulifera solaris]
MILEGTSDPTFRGHHHQTVIASRTSYEEGNQKADMIVASQKSPVKASPVRLDAGKAFTFDGANAGGFHLSAESDDSKIDKRQVDVDQGEYLSNNVSGLSSGWEERDGSVEHREGWADDNAWDRKQERDAPPIAPAASDALEKIREMRQILEADPTLKESLSKTESMTLSKNDSNPELYPYVFRKTSSNALDALRAVRMQLEANKDVAKAVSETMHGTPRKGLPPRSPAKHLADRSFPKSNGTDALQSLPESLPQSAREKEYDQDGGEDEVADDRSVASLVGPPPPPPPIDMNRSEGSVFKESSLVRIPIEPMSPSAGVNTTRDEQRLVSPRNVEEQGTVDPESDVRPRSSKPGRGRLSIKKLFKKGVVKAEPEARLLSPDPTPSDESNQQELNAAEEEDVQDPSVEVILKGYVAPEEIEETCHSRIRRRGVKSLFKKLGRKNRAEVPDKSPETVSGKEETTSGQVDNGESSQRLFSSDSFINEGTVNMDNHRVDAVDDDDSVGPAPYGESSGVGDRNKVVEADEDPFQEIINRHRPTFAPVEPESVDTFDIVNDLDFESRRLDIDVREIERKMKQKRATDASTSSSRVPVALAGTAGKKVGHMPSTASVKSSRTTKNTRTSKNRPTPNMTPKKPAVYYSGKLAGNAGATQRGDRGKYRDDHMSFTRWPQE